MDQNNKQSLLLELLRQQDMKRVLVFTRTKHRADKITRMLTKNRISANAIHGNKSQNQRTRTLDNFKSGRLQVLVATDIAARGIDIDGISHVINYDLPNEPKSYVHRIGRTGRAGAKGIAYSFCAADERNILRSIERLTQMKIDVRAHQYHSNRAKNAVPMAVAAESAHNKSRISPRNSRSKSIYELGPRKSYTVRLG